VGWLYVFATSGTAFALFGLLILASGLALFALWGRKRLS
jgi:hypothetical protein